MMIRKFFKSDSKVKEAKDAKSRETRESKVAEAPPVDANLSLHHFILHDLLGEGAFGKVIFDN